MPDDLMNLHRAARMPAGELARETATIWGGQWRPFGFLLFKGMYGAFGFNPLPYHAVALGLLAANLALVAWLAWKLTGSGAAAAFTALLAAHHGYFSDLYWNSGTMFDTLAGMMCLGLLASHAGEARPGWGRVAVQGAVYTLALQTKEIAVFLPAAVWAHEWLVRRDGGAWRTARQAWVYTGLTGVFALGMVLGGGEVMGNPDYRPVLTAASLLERWEHYLATMFYQPYGPGMGYVAGVLGVAAGSAWLLGDAAARWAWVVAMAAPLPLLAITPRSYYAFYVPYLFWALMVGCVLARVTRWWRWAPVVGFVVMAGLLVKAHLWVRPYAEKWKELAEEELRPAIQYVAPEARKWRQGAVILFVDDPYPVDDYTLLYVATLAKGDLGLFVHRAKAGAQADDAGALKYTLSRDGLRRE